ncbi:MAG: gamma-glutamyltransferase [Ignavibacteriales bacterium]|nr:gamma-glutamyltransferase [Ignavibacteriales bacterium]
MNSTQRSIGCLILLILAHLDLNAKEPAYRPASPAKRGEPGRPLAAKHGVVVSSHYLASELGVQVLKNGGNAVDAAVATGLALAVVHPSAGNIGGGGFMIVYTTTGEVTAFDFREKAPLAAHGKMYLDNNEKYINDLNHEGYLSVGVPGTVAGFDLALKRFGTKSWKELAAPAVALAEEGFLLSASMANEFTSYEKDWKKYPSSAKSFLKGDGSFYAANEIWKQPDLAATLKTIAANGRDGFYQGDVARAIAKDMKNHGGLITEEDLAKYEAKERKPVRGTYRGCDVVSMSPPSSGGTALVEMLNILEGFNLKPLGHNTAAYLHRLIETMRRGFADRARYLGDPDFNPDMPIAKLTSKQYAEHLRASINPAKASKSDSIQFNDAYESEQTTHYSVVDAEGNAVVVTYTLEYGYGSRIVADGLGFLYNNEMGDFNPIPGTTDTRGTIGTKPNLVQSGKRMLSSMTPTILAKNGKPYLLIGSPGGRTIINTVLQVVLNVVDFEMNIADAIAAKRIHHQWLPDQVRYERNGLTDGTKKTLEAMGHTFWMYSSQGSVMGIIIDAQTGMRYGAADPRAADGGAAGY